MERGFIASNEMEAERRRQRWKGGSENPTSRTKTTMQLHSSLVQNIDNALHTRQNAHI